MAITGRVGRAARWRVVRTLCAVDRRPASTKDARRRPVQVDSQRTPGKRRTARILGQSQPNAFEVVETQPAGKKIGHGGCDGGRRDFIAPLMDGGAAHLSTREYPTSNVS